MSIDISELRQLPPEEKLQIIGELWDSLATEQLPLPQWQIDEIERRDKAYRENPSAVIPWEQVKENIRRRNA
jgi:putative addiction module component (TIGR02574 family)